MSQFLLPPLVAITPDIWIVKATESLASTVNSCERPRETGFKSLLFDAESNMASASNLWWQLHIKLIHGSLLRDSAKALYTIEQIMHANFSRRMREDSSTAPNDGGNDSVCWQWSWRLLFKTNFPSVIHGSSLRHGQKSHVWCLLLISPCAELQSEDPQSVPSWGFRLCGRSLCRGR